MTAGNASGINDGAAALVLMSAEQAAKKGIPALAKIVAIAETGVEPDIMGIGPVPAVELVVSNILFSQSIGQLMICLLLC